MNKLIYIVEDDTSIKELESYALINSDFSVGAFDRAKGLYSALEDNIQFQNILICISTFGSGTM